MHSDVVTIEAQYAGYAPNEVRVSESGIIEQMNAAYDAMTAQGQTILSDIRAERMPTGLYGDWSPLLKRRSKHAGARAQRSKAKRKARK